MAEKRKSRTVLIGLIVILLGVGGAGFGLWRLGSVWLENSRWSRLESARVEGLERLSEKEILRAANLRAGLNIMQLSLDDIAARVMKVPGVKSARVSPKIPYRVQIAVEEREPIACLQKEKIFLVDDQGVLFPTVGAGELIDLPVITGEVAANKSNAGLRRAVAFIAKTKEAYPTIYSHLGEVIVKGGKIEFRLKEGGAAVLSGDPTSPATLVKLEQFLIQRGGELTSRSQYVDLRYPAMIVTGTEG